MFVIIIFLKDNIFSDLCESSWKRVALKIAVVHLFVHFTYHSLELPDTVSGNRTDIMFDSRFQKNV